MARQYKKGIGLMAAITGSLADRFLMPERSDPVHGLSSPNQRVERPLFKRIAYELLGASPLSMKVALRHSASWAGR